MRRWPVLALTAIIFAGCAREDWTARVGNTIIREEQVETMVQRGISREEAVNTLIEEALMYEDAVAKGYLEDMKDEIRRAENRPLVMGLYQRVVTDRIRISPYRIKEHWNRSNREVKARKIMVKERNKAKEIHRSLFRGGDFAEIAIRESEDRRTATLGGDLGWIGYPARMDPIIQDVIFSMKKGETSRPFKSGENWVIINVEDIRHKEGRKLDRNERNRIETTLKRVEERRAANAFLERLKKLGGIRFDENVVETLARSVGRGRLPDPASCGGETVVLTSHVKTITANELVELAETRRSPPLNDPENIKNFLTSYLTMEILLPATAKRYKVHKNPEIARTIEDGVRNIVLREYRRIMIETKLKTPTEQEIETYYKDNIEQFTEEARVRALDEVRREITGIIRENQREEVTDNLIEELKSRIPIYFRYCEKKHERI